MGQNTGSKSHSQYSMNYTDTEINNIQLKKDSLTHAHGSCNHTTKIQPTPAWRQEDKAC